MKNRGKFVRRVSMAGAATALVAGAALAGPAQAHAATNIEGIYADYQTCYDNGLDKFGHVDVFLKSNVWACTINPGPDGGWMLYYDDSTPGD